MASSVTPSLIEWLGRLGHAVNGWADLRDGRAIGAELQRMGATTDAADIHAVQTLICYYHSTLESHTPLLDTLPADLAIASDAELQSILQLLLGAAVQSEAREVYVGAIMELPEDAQTDLMGQVEAVMQDVMPWEGHATTLTSDPAPEESEGGAAVASQDHPAGAAGGVGQGSVRALQHQLSAAMVELEDVRRTNAALRAELVELRRQFAASGSVDHDPTAPKRQGLQSSPSRPGAFG